RGREHLHLFHLPVSHVLFPRDGKRQPCPAHRRRLGAGRHAPRDRFLPALAALDEPRDVQVFLPQKMTNDWTIQSRSTHCAATGAAFAEGEYFYTLLFHEKDGFRREDLCEDAF